MPARVALAFKDLRENVHGFPVRGSFRGCNHRVPAIAITVHGGTDAMKTAISFRLLGSAFLAMPASATGTHVSRCDTGDGSAVYTDGSCRAVGGRPVPMSATLLRGLAREGAFDGDTNIRPTGTPARAGGPANLRV